MTGGVAQENDTGRDRLSTGGRCPRPVPGLPRSISGKMKMQVSGEARQDEPDRRLQTGGRDAVGDAVHHLARDVEARVPQGGVRLGHRREGHDVVGIAMEHHHRGLRKSHRRPARPAPATGPRSRTIAATGAGATGSDMKAHHRALREAEKNEAVGAEPLVGEDLVEETRRASPTDAASERPTAASSDPSIQGIGNHCRPAGLTVQGSGASGA